MSLAQLIPEARAVLDEAVALRRTLHRSPEVGLVLPRTTDVVLGALGGLPLTVYRHERTSGVVAVLEGSSPGPTTLLRADMDALPMREDTGLEFSSDLPAMHACGHDLHVAMLVGAARLLSARRHEMPGRVVFMFQPGEEGEHGARWMLEEGLLEAADPPPSRALALHVLTGLPSGTVASRPGPVMAASDQLRITVVGRGGHASMPHLAADPVPVAAEIVTAVQTAITRRIGVFDPAVVTFGVMSAGSVHNVIPESAFLHGTIRTISAQTRSAVHRLAAEIPAGIAAAHGLTADVEVELGYPVTVNDPQVHAAVGRLGAELLGEERIVNLPAPLMGAEDWSYVLQRVPGAMVFLGACPPGVDPSTAPSIHSNRVEFDEEAMVTGIALHAAFALH